MSHGKTWADRAGLPTGVMGEYYYDIHICEANRATVYEERREGIETLCAIRDSYRRKSVDAAVFGIDGGKNIQYAVFVQSGFLRDVDAQK